MCQFERPPITVGLVTLLGGSSPSVSPYCPAAVEILNKSTINGKKEASNPFYNLAAQKVKPILRFRVSVAQSG